MVQFKIQSKLKNFSQNVKLRKLQFSIQAAQQRVYAGACEKLKIPPSINWSPYFPYWPFICQTLFVTRYYFFLVKSGNDRSHYPAIQVLNIGAASPQTLVIRPAKETSDNAALQEEEQKLT